MPYDLELGTRRARAAALLAMALPGSVYVYQGEELGLWEVEDIPDEMREDPIWARSGHTDRGRDGCRVPLPWSGDAPPFGFSTDRSWLPQPAGWNTMTVEAEQNDPESMHSLYRSALAIRHERLGDGTMAWLPLGDGVLAFTRQSGVICVVNLSSEPVRLPPHESVLLTSGPIDGDLLPTDTAAWLSS
jgi:alpha-glucosidase